MVPDGDPGADVTGRVVDPPDVCFGPDTEGSTEPEVSGAEFDPDEAGELIDDEPEEEGGAEDDGLDVSALATPCPVATAAPTPKATANPPTRPTYGAAFIVPPY